MASWLVAWDRYALGAVVTGQLSFGHAMAHKAVVAEIAALNRASPLLPVVYDELVR